MPRSSKNKKVSRKSRNDSETSQKAISFNTRKIPRILASGRQEDRVTTLPLGDDFTIVSDSSGLVQTVQSCTPIGCGNWSSYVSTFDEYRVLAVQFEFEPIIAVGGSSTLFYAPIAHIFDRDSVGPLTSYALASRYGSWGEAPGQRRWKKLISMKSPEEATFVSMATTKTLGWLQLYSSGNNPSTGLGRMKMTVFVQFRGTGI